jgi:hypothetical protein
MPLMPSYRKAKTQKVQIDADWLLGPNTRVPKSAAKSIGFGSLLALLFLFSTVGVVACYWETWSQQLLRWQWERWLAAEETDEDTLAALIALGDRFENSSVLLIQQLQSDNATRRAVAFQVLKSQCDSPSFKKLTEPQQQAIVTSLEQWKPADPDAVMMRDWIAARMTSLLVASGNPTKIEMRQQLTEMMDSGSGSLGRPSGASGRSLLLTGSTPPSLAPATISTPPAPPLPGPNISKSSDTKLTQDSSIESPRVEEPIPPREPPPRPSREPTRIRISNQTNVRTIAASQSMSLSDREAPEPPQSNQMSVIVQVKPERTVEQLLRSLEQVSDEEVVGILNELQSQGFSELHVELAMALARGTSEDRLLALDALSNDPTINPLPWLAWMSESQDSPSRMKAIAMLSSTTDPEALRFLRLMQQRESDPRIANHIQQALQAHGTAPSTKR